MSKDPSKKMPLIVSQNQKKDSNSKPLPYEAGKETYQRFENTKNPFEGRSLNTDTPQSKLPSQSLKNLLHVLRERQEYRVAPQAEDLPHYKRRVSQPRYPHGNPKFAKSTTLHQDQNRLEGYIKYFFQETLNQLEENPYSLPWVVNELVSLLQEQGLRIKVYDAYQQFHHWIQFMETLKALSQDPEQENFELFCSALIGFYSQIQEG